MLFSTTRSSLGKLEESPSQSKSHRQIPHFLFPSLDSNPSQDSVSELGFERLEMQPVPSVVVVDGLNFNALFQVLFKSQ